MVDGIDSVIERTADAAQGLNSYRSGVFCASPTQSTAERKRSLHLTLVLVSAAALSACGGLETDKNMSRDAYASLEACKADWAAAGDCEAVKPGTTSSTGSAMHSFYGPRYYSRSGSGSSGSSGFSSAARPGSNAVGTVSGSASRGGFGASSAHHSGGSSGSAHSSGG